MSRAVPEWIGKTDDTPIPRRVKDRVTDAAGNCCAECTVEFSGIIKPEIDHRIAIISGGENRESNLQPLCKNCHRSKTNQDVAIKADVARVRGKFRGFEKRKRLIPGSKGSGSRKRMDGTVLFVKE